MTAGPLSGATSQPMFMQFTGCKASSAFLIIGQKMQLTGWDDANYIQLLNETEQNIVTYQWRADQLFDDAEGRGK